MGAKAEAAQAELDAYKIKVRSTAIATAKERGWCEPGLNGILEELELPRKNPQRIPVDITFTQRKFVTIDDAIDADSARAQLAAMTPEQVGEKLETARGLTVTSFTVPDPADAEIGAEGVTDGTLRSDLAPGLYASRAEGRCNRLSTNGYVCTREGRDHTRHIASTMDRVVQVWSTDDAMDCGVYRNY